MPSVLEWYLLGVVLLFVALFAVAGYYDAKSSGDAVEQWSGTPTGWYLVAGFFGVVVAGCIAVYGTVPEGFGGRRELFVLLAHVAPLVVGSGGLAVAANNGLAFLRLRRADGVATGAVDDREAGDPVTVTGVVDAAPGTSPVFERDAACWTWTFSIRWEERVETGWKTNSVGSGGVPFPLDDGSGPVSVRPGNAHLELAGGRTESYDVDADQPGDVGANLRSSLGGDRYRYEESIAAEGRELTVLGRVTEDGDVEAKRIVDADASGVEQRYAARAVVLALAGLFGVLLGVRLTADYFDAVLPF